MILSLLFILSYLWGMIPFGYLYGKFLGYGDIYKHGSGNIGATNAYRLGGKKLAILTLASDFLKGALPILILKFIGNDAILPWVGLMTVMGHNRFPYNKGGGKGVATAAGFWLAYAPLVGLILTAVWVALMVTVRISSLAGLVAAALMPVLAYAFGKSIEVSLLLFFLITFAHRENIIRLISGEEKKVGSKD